MSLGYDVDRPWRELPTKDRDWILFTDEQPTVPDKRLRRSSLSVKIAGLDTGELSSHSLKALAAAMRDYADTFSRRASASASCDPVSISTHI